MRSWKLYIWAVAMFLIASGFINPAMDNGGLYFIGLIGFYMAGVAFSVWAVAVAKKGK